MPDLPWLRLYSDVIDNEKVRLLAFEDRWHFIAILCCKQQGIIDSSDKLLSRKLAVKLGVQLRELDEIKRRLIEVELITEDWQPKGWENKQFKSDSSTERTRKYREKQKGNKCETSQERHSDALDTDTDTDINTTDTNVSVVRNEKFVPDCPHQEIINLYKKNCPEAIHPRTWDGARALALKARWREDKERQYLEWWNKFFNYISKSDFLMGRTQALKREPFRLSLDWIVTKSNFSKILDGKYEN